MSSYCSAFSFDTLCRAFGQHVSVPLGGVFTPGLLSRLACRHQVCFATGANDFWSAAPATAAWAWQCLFSDKSCVAAVSRVVALCVVLGLAVPSANTGAYCKSRQKLPVGFLRELAQAVSRLLEQEAPSRWRWRGRRVILVDGTTLDAPDTAANQAEYPQHHQQQQGLGFPILRMVVLFGLATASLLSCAFGRFQGDDTGETALLRGLLDELQEGDVLVADRYYCAWWLVALAQRRGILVCFRLSAARKQEFPGGPKGRADDYQATWHKPKRPDRMDPGLYASLPDSLRLRIVDYRVAVPGFRPSRVTVATTLLCDKEFPAEDIADLYHKRWHVEVDIRAIKQAMQMQELSCLSPEMLQAEIWAHWLSYNLARLVAAQAALAAGLQPRQVSFSAARANLESFRQALASGTGQEWDKTVRQLWRAITAHRVGDRPGRSEPREKKRRGKNKYEPLRQPRQQRRAQLLREKMAEEGKGRQEAAKQEGKPEQRPPAQPQAAKAKARKDKQAVPA